MQLSIMTSALSITLFAAFIVAALVVAEAKGKGPSITHKVPLPHPNQLWHVSHPSFFLLDYFRFTSISPLEANPQVALPWDCTIAPNLCCLVNPLICCLQLRQERPQDRRELSRTLHGREGICVCLRFSCVRVQMCMRVRGYKEVSNFSVWVIQKKIYLYSIALTRGDRALATKTAFSTASSRTS
jgi:hypothetical protein